MRPANLDAVDLSIYADWLEDAGADTAEVRAEIADPPANQWVYESRVGFVGGVGGDEGVGFVGGGGVGGVVGGVGVVGVVGGGGVGGVGGVGGGVGGDPPS
jgi:hypothetical protein